MAKRTKRKATVKAKSKSGKTRKKVGRKNVARRRAAPKKTRKTLKKTLPRAKKKRGGVARGRMRKQKPGRTVGTVDTAIIDVIAEPVPGVVTITEYEASSIAVPDSDEEE
jgi:hypothetical protein